MVSCHAYYLWSSVLSFPRQRSYTHDANPLDPMELSNGDHSTSSVYKSSGSSTGPPELRILHYNDVYHIEAGSAEPVGGITRFQTVVNRYRSAPEYKDQPKLITLFSGDAYNPSLESSVTKGRHMVPVLNNIGTDVACVGVSMDAYLLDHLLSPICEYLLRMMLYRTTTSILAYPNSGISPPNATSPGFWPMFSILLWATTSLSLIAQKH